MSQNANQGPKHPHQGSHDTQFTLPAAQASCTASLQAAAEQILATALAIVDAPMGYLHILNPQDKTSHITTSHALCAQSLAEIPTHSLLEHPAFAQSLTEGRAVTLTDLDQEPCPGVAPSLVTIDQVKVLHVVPLISQATTLQGYVALCDHKPIELGGKSVLTLDLYRQQAAELIELLRREQWLRTHRKRQAFLLHLNERLRSLSDGESIARIVAQELGTYLGADQVGYVSVADSGEIVPLSPGWQAQGVAGYSGYHHRDKLSPVLSAAIGRAEPIVLADVQETPLNEVDLASFNDNNVRAVLAAPVIKENNFVGALFVLQRRPRAWSADEASLVQEVATWAWSAIEQAQAEERLRNSESRFRALVTASSQVLYQMSPDWSEMRQLHSRGFLDPTQKPTRRWLEQYIPPEDQRLVRDAIQSALSDKRTFELEHRVLKSDSSHGWVISRAVPLCDAEGEIVEWFGAAFDITETKQAQEDLRAAKAVAEEASRAKSEFLAHMSHEIRTPMTVFLLALERLGRLDHGPEQHQLLDMAVRSARHLRTLIDDILDVSAIEAQQVKIADEPVNPRRCIEDAAALLRLAAAEKNLAITVDIDPRVPEYIRSDQDRLSQVLMNLVGNAVKFTERGSVKISLRVKEERLFFSVTDTGFGIAQEQQKLLFRSFSQVDRLRSRNQGGTGLGLAICRGLVELMGGEIGVESRPGEGSTFWFDLPLQLSLAPSSEAQALGEEPRIKAQGKPLRILLAEDDEMIQDLMSIVLRKRGHFVDLVTDGRQALERMRSDHFDIVLLDMHMPRMDGLEAAREIRRLEAQRGDAAVRIIVLTADARKEVQGLCQDAGIDSFLSKPLRLDALFAAIER
jgi:signal transduction histidine kinase